MAVKCSPNHQTQTATTSILKRSGAAAGEKSVDNGKKAVQFDERLQMRVFRVKLSGEALLRPWRKVRVHASSAAAQAQSLRHDPTSLQNQLRKAIARARADEGYAAHAGTRDAATTLELLALCNDRVDETVRVVP